MAIETHDVPAVAGAHGRCGHLAFSKRKQNALHVLRDIANRQLTESAATSPCGAIGVRTRELGEISALLNLTTQGHRLTVRSHPCLGACLLRRT